MRPLAKHPAEPRTPQNSITSAPQICPVNTDTQLPPPSAKKPGCG